MAFKFVLLFCVAAAAAQGIVTAEFNYNPDLYNGNNSNNNQNNGVYNNNINSYDDNVKQPANSYNAPLAALNAFNGKAPAQPQQQQQQQQPNSNGYNYNPNNYNNNAAQLPPENQQGQTARQRNYDFNNGAAQKQLPNSVPTPSGYDYSPQNFAGLSSSSSASASALDSDATFTKLETSFNSQAHLLSAPTVAPVEEYNPPAKYDYSYNVHDDETGDIKSHAEARDGYFVQGSYSVVDPDGFQRTVSYTVDGPSGFNAVVNRVPYAIKAVRTIALSAPASSVAPVTKLAELPLSNDISLTESSAGSASSSSAAEPTAIDTTGTELPVQLHDSYLAPPVDSRDGKGPYP